MSFIRKLRSSIKWFLGGGKKRHRLFLLQRNINQEHCYDYPAVNLGWKKFGKTPVYGNYESGSVFDPYVFVDGELFMMVVSERKSGSLLLIESSDGINWRKRSHILLPKPHTWEHIVNRGCLINVDGIWHLWYTGQNKGVGYIGHLKSNNCLEFTRPKNNMPVLKPTMILEGDSVMNPCVLWDKKKRVFKMWYAAGENYEPDALFYAESDDGDCWVKREEPILMKTDKNLWEQYKVGGCDVKQLSESSYVMYYIGYQNLDVARICIAFSKNGVQWERPDDNVIIAPSEDGWDKHAIYKPSYIMLNNKHYIWYNGRNGDEEYIGLAIKYTK